MSFHSIKKYSLRPASLGKIAWTVALLIIPIALHAEEPASEPTKPLTLADAVALSLSGNPALAADNYNLRAAEAQRIRAGYRPNPAISLEAEDIPGSGGNSGADQAQTTLRLSQVIEMGGKRAQRIAEARLSNNLAAWDYETRRLDVLAATTQRFIEVVAAQERLVLADEATKLAEAELSAVSERVKAARNSVVDQKKAEIAVAREKLEQGHARHALLIARKSLSASWGNANPAFTVAKADFFTTSRPEVFGSLMARIGSNPDLARFATEARLRDAQLQLARTRGVPDVTISVGTRRYAEQGEWTGVFGVAVPLPFFDRGQAEVYEALQMRGKTEALGRAIRVALATKIFGTYQELLHSVTALDTMAKEILPAAREVMKASDDGYKQGRFSYLELADARRSFIELRRQNLEAALNYHTYQAEIDRLIGASTLIPHDAEPVSKRKN